MMAFFSALPSPLRRSAFSALLPLLPLALGCAPDHGPCGLLVSETPIPSGPEVGFTEVPPRDVELHGKTVHLAATARMFHNLWPASEGASQKPIFVLFNGFAAEVVRAFGTGPVTVADGGDVEENPATLTEIGNLLYIDPRQSGFSYDVKAEGKPSEAECNGDVFNEYVDAADVLFAVLSVLEKHPELTGPVVWVGESYGGVRIQWILAYLRHRWDLAAYEDPALEQAIERSSRGAALRAGQALLEPWLAGAAHAAAIKVACADPELVTAVETSLGAACQSSDACSCAQQNGRSRYNFAYTAEHQKAREFQASEAHVQLDKAARLFGARLEELPELRADQRAKGFKCDTADDETPDESELESALGTLPKGQSYFLAYAPLQPGKELVQVKRDWFVENFVGNAFIDNLHDVPALVTDGPYDLVVPERALAPALRIIAGEERIATTNAGVSVAYPDGSRTIAVRSYPASGHMITMLDSQAFSDDLRAWTAQAAK